MSERRDVVVIGAGVNGVSTAYFLARKGVKRVLLLEREGVASGATGRSAALVRMHYTNPWDALLALRSWEMFQHWNDLVGGECGFRTTGFLLLAAHHDREHLLANIQMLQSIGVNTCYLPPEDVRLAYPYMVTDDLAGAAYEPESGYADGSDTTHSLLRAARREGVEVRLGTPALRLLVEKGRITGVETPQGPIATGTVVVAAGAWAAPLLATAGVTLPITPMRIGAGIVVRPAQVPFHPVVIDRSIGFYFRPDGVQEARLTLVGVHGREHRTPADPDAFRREPTYEEVELTIQRLVRRIPGMADAYWKRTWCGVDGYTPDGHMVLGAVPEVQGLYVAGGSSGTGFKTGPAVGLCMAEVIVEGRAHTVDITAFRPTRFAEGQPLVSPHEYRVSA
ncbi:MAG: FAD-binding oxidoreductase [Dehalococcoidia bacterium]|nr:FAD-binding oxidoreductase [Dehalococcoidia bacterium]MDW8120557.1 FAD-dependent oxidoreductase [Chloroflexota bacterium]